MENINVFNSQPPSVPYQIIVDRQGRLIDREVREGSYKREKRPVFQKEKGLIQAYDQPPTPAQQENLKKDAIFKMLLNEQKYAEEVATPFIRAFWGHKTEVSELKVITATLQGSTMDSRDAIPDTIWQSQRTGDVFLTEMQRRPQIFYNQRISLYEGKLRATLAEKGQGWDYNQVSVFVLGMAEFDLERPPSEDYIYEYVSMNPKNNKDLMTGRDWKMMADLKKAKKIKTGEYMEREKWIYLLNNFHRLKRIPSFLKGGYFDKVIEIAKNLNRTKMEELMDFLWEFHKKDLHREAMELAEAKGLAKGMAKGMTKGMAKGMDMVKNIIKSFISTHPSCSIQDAAAQLGVEEKLIKRLITSQA